MEKADGDFIVFIFDENKSLKYVFNDNLGRLPLYYSENCDGISICCELKGILEHLTKISFNKYEIVNHTVLGYTLGKNTIYDNVFRMMPGELLTITESKKIRIQNTYSISYEIADPFKSKKEAIHYIHSSFLKSVKNRVEKSHELGYSIISDLSGGFDSRALIGGLSKYDKNVNYYTFEYVQDESPIAKDVFNILDEPRNYKKLVFKNLLNIDEVPSIHEFLDGLSNYYTSYICYKDLDFLYRTEENHKVVRFGGLGGEFFRHPIHTSRDSVEYEILSDNYDRKLAQYSLLLDFDIDEYKDYLKTYFKKRNKIEDGKLKQLYVEEYYRTRVGLNSEDRERIHFWGIQPFWNHELVQAFVCRLPLKWINYDFFTMLLKEIDPSLLKIAIFGKKINLASRFQVLLFDISKNILSIINRSETKIALIAKKIKRKILNKPLTGNQLNLGNNDILLKIFKELNYGQRIFDKNEMIKYLSSCSEENKMIGSYIFLLNQLESRYPNKFNCEK